MCQMEVPGWAGQGRASPREDGEAAWGAQRTEALSSLVLSSLYPDTMALSALRLRPFGVCEGQRQRAGWNPAAWTGPSSSL